MDIQNYKGVMVLGEQKDGHIRPVTFELLNRGRDLADKLGVELSCSILGNEIEDLTEIIYRGADKVFHVAGPALAGFLPGPYARALVRLVQEERPEIFIAAATTTGRTVMPLVAAGLKTGLTADCTLLDIDDKEKILLQTRPAIGGNIMATIKTPFTRPQMATVRPRSARPAHRDESRTGLISVKNYGDSPVSAVERFLAYVPDATQEVSIEDADIIVAGGKGLKTRDGFKLVEELARLLGAGVGASRDVVDLGWASYPHQIGLSGKTVSPKLYIAVGISGKVQHLAGMQTSETIVAINRDPEAQIFQVADFGIVGDAFEVLPELMGALKNAPGRRLREGSEDNAL
ncbi:electron transfer flavoprotein subunit alpha/FixB family protein [Desulfotomaculum copahuensis]|uniref:Electron transfer flavoprotein subunit alpha n=1 Tax=Desulfotomaculum copahuensis TaxID=1838280 RepID=A0A1B7LEE0_9FIRM|nr:electron transfer flavoprotein subunit alpha/FixB family protein [Desulfotomaculum copahuensis]OAT81653.1 electron transfer flavoprotein subunit alpha [Desulfotomaculum copahuensis]